MFEYKLAYRHANGEVEGFVGTGFTESAAQRNAEVKAANKCIDARLPFEWNNLIYSPKNLTKTEMEVVQNDWKLK